MGLTPFQEHRDIEKALATATEIGEKYLDIDSIWKIANEAGTIKAVVSRQSSVISPNRQRTTPIQSSLPTRQADNGPRIGVIRDSAFQFYYQENLEELEKRGAKLIEISPLREKQLPDIDALYIGGGFPETHAIALADNISFKKSLLKAVEKGLPVYAECGGLMYLGKSLILKNSTYLMAGIFPIVFSMQKKPQAHGYTIIKVEKTNPYFPKGSILKGHEFHYSSVIELKETRTYTMVLKVQRGKGIKDGMDGICYKNVLATYTHLHALGATAWTDGLIRCALKFRKLNVKKVKAG